MKQQKITRRKTRRKMDETKDAVHNNNNQDRLADEFTRAVNETSKKDRTATPN